METNTMESVAVNENAAATETANTGNGKENLKLDKGTHVLEKEEFSRGVSKGLSFWFKQYKSLEDAIKHLDALNKQPDLNGEAIVLGLLNNAIKSNLRGRANSKIPTGGEENDAELRKAEIAALVATGKSVLVDEVTAENYVPGTREKTSIPALWKEYNSLKEDAMEAKKRGNTEDFEDYKAQAKEVYARIQVLMAADDNLDNL